jgi:nicotinate phosphoribosyltransferase
MPAAAPPPALLTDRYQLTMLAGYAHAGLAGRRAVFELFVRSLPPARRFLVACGLGRALGALEGLRFSDDDLARFAEDSMLGPALARAPVRDFFASFRFGARVSAVPEGRLAFPHEPLARVEGTLAEAQLVETFLLSAVNHDARVASKCARVTLAAAGRPCFEFGSRRTHEAAAVDAARAAYVAGFAGTSNEWAARLYGLPVAGTMAHSFVLAHAADGGEGGEARAFADFAAAFDQPVTCLVDTFDALRGVERAAAALGPRLGGVRIDSGDLEALARGARARLDAGGCRGARVGVSNDLDEYQVERLVASGAPVDSFGVGTTAVCTPDAPALGAVYKLVALEDAAGRMVAVQKRAPGKGSTAGVKQVFRRPGTLDDVLGLEGEAPGGEPLLELAFDGRRVVADASAAAARARFEADLAAAPAHLRRLAPRDEGEGYPVRTSEALRALQDEVARSGRAALPE